MRWKTENTQQQAADKQCESGRQRRRKVVLVAAGAGVLVLAVLIVLLVGGKQPLEDSTGDVLEGTWVYNEYIRYEFDGQGNGCLIQESLRFSYTYQISDGTLRMDFADGAVRDCVYTFSVDADVLTLNGGDGTAGGTYILKATHSD